MRVYGHSNDDGQQRWCTFGGNPNAWYRKVVQPYIGRVGEQEEDGVWEKVQEPDGAGAYRQVVLGIMLARPAESESHRLETCTTLDGVPFHQVTRDSRLWRRLRPTELDAGERGGGRISMMNNRLGLVHAWHVVPLRKELETEEALALPDVERGKLMHLVLPFAMWSRHGSNISFTRPSRFGVLGIGFELYSHQLYTLAWVFLLMGLISFSELIANLTAGEFTSAEFAAATGDRANWGTSAWVEGWLIGTTVGTRAQPFDLKASGHTTLATTLFFLAYLVFLRFLNIGRARALFRARVESGDYTVEVRGLSSVSPPIKYADQVADVVARRVQWHWKHTRSNGGGEWCGTGKNRFMRLPLTERERDNSSTIAKVMHSRAKDLPAGRAGIVHDVNGAFDEFPARIQAEEKKKEVILGRAERAAKALYRQQALLSA